MFRERSKHIDIRWHYVRSQVRERTLQLCACGTEDMLGDALTKPLGWVKYARFFMVIMNFRVDGSTR